MAETLSLFEAPAEARPPLWAWMESLSPEERVWWDAMTDRCSVDFVTDKQAEIERISRARAGGLEIIDDGADHSRRRRRLWVRRGAEAELAAILMRERPLFGWDLSEVPVLGSDVLRIAVEPKTVQEMGAYEKKKASTTGPRRLMTEAEISTILRLSECRFSPGSWDKRFVRDMQHEASQLNPLITERQAEQLPRLAHRYRKQLAAQKEPRRG